MDKASSIRDIGPRPPPLPDRFWEAVAAFLRGRVGAKDAILAPNEFLHEFPGTYPIHIQRRMISYVELRFYVLHKGMLARADPVLLREALAGVPVFANQVFAVFAPTGTRLPAADEPHLAAVFEHARSLPAPSSSQGVLAAVVATHERPRMLGCMLRSLARQCRILVVVDGSRRPNAMRNRMATFRHGATYLRVPMNLGVANALNVGIMHALAQLDVEYISVFDDDVELAAGALSIIDEVARASPYEPHRTLVTGYLNPAHPAHTPTRIAGRDVLLARSASGHHLHAHRRYWEGVLPIPTQYPRAPKPEGALLPGQGSDTDWWNASWAPAACIKSGAEVVVVPDMVRNLGADRSTWDAGGY